MVVINHRIGTIITSQGREGFIFLIWVGWGGRGGELAPTYRFLFPPTDCAKSLRVVNRDWLGRLDWRRTPRPEHVPEALVGQLAAIQIHLLVVHIHPPKGYMQR